MPSGVAAREIEGWIRATEIIETNRIYLRQIREPFVAVEVSGFEAAVVLIDEIPKMLKILSPIIIGVCRDLVAILISSGDGVVVREVARIDERGMKSMETNRKAKSGRSR